MEGAAENRSKEGVAANHRTDLKKLCILKMFLKKGSINVFTYEV
jgi:hypothetical protein